MKNLRMNKKWVRARWAMAAVTAGLFAATALAQSPESVGPPTITPHKTTKPRSSSSSGNSDNTNGAADAPAPTPKSSPVMRSTGDNPITNEPPSMPVDDIIKKFSERESEFKRERANYTYTQTFSIQTLDDYLDPGVEDSIYNEPAFKNEFANDLNGILKWEGLGKNETTTPRFRSLIARYRLVMGMAGVGGQKTARDLIAAAIK